MKAGIKYNTTNRTFKTESKS